MVALPIHDSFLVSTAEDQPFDGLQSTMRQVFREKSGQPCEIKLDPVAKRDELTLDEAETRYSLFFQRWDEWPYLDPTATIYLEKHYPEVLERLGGGTPDEIYD